MQQPVLKLGTAHDNVIGQHEAAFKTTAGDAAMQETAGFFWRGLGAPNHRQRVLMGGDVQICLGKPSHGHGQHIAVIGGLFDIVGRVTPGIGTSTGRVHQPRQAIKANGGTEKGGKISSVHSRDTPLQSKVR